MVIEWSPVTPGRTEIGSDNRSILFGGIGPKHMVDIKYRFSITKHPIGIQEAEELIESKEAGLASESEWKLAFDQGVIRGNDQLEKLSDRFKGNYWGKALDGRPQLMDDWTFRIAKQWSSEKPKTRLVARGIEEPNFVRLVKVEEISEYDPFPQTLPTNRATTRLLKEEVAIAVFVGIIPSFVWAYFNASQEYIETGWPGLVFGGIILGLVTGIFWRPKTTSYRLGRNCGKVKPNASKETYFSVLKAPEFPGERRN